jgi:hypothetical protein
MGEDMMEKTFDRWALCGFTILFSAIAIYGMRIGNAGITDFGKYGFAGCFSGLMLVLNRDLGVGNGSGSADPTQGDSEGH